MNVAWIYFGLGAGLALLLGMIVGMIVVLVRRKWNIPVVIFRFTGDKRRPPIVLTKARKEVVDNCVQLRVKGYRRRFRDFMSENYYPSPGTRSGGLVLFEFEDGWLTPLRASWKQLTPEERARCQEALTTLENVTKTVDFEYDKAIHDRLKLTIIDDVDSESFLIDQSRIRSQYQGSWGWLKEHAALIVIIVAFICLTTGFIVWLNEDPANAAQVCVASLRDVCRDAWNVTITQNQDYARELLQRVAGQAPPG